MDGWMDEEGWKAQDKTELLTNTLETYVKEVGLSAAFDLLLYKYRDFNDSLARAGWTASTRPEDLEGMDGWMDGWMNRVGKPRTKRNC